jgi:hypothetical protein
MAAVAVAAALLAAPTVHAAAGNNRPVAHAQQLEPKQMQPNGSGKSYFWREAAIAGGVLAGIVALGLWGDVVIGGAILGIQLVSAGAAIAACRVGTHTRRATRRTSRVTESNPAASSR